VLLWELNHPPIVPLGRDPRSGAYRRLADDGGLTSTPGLLIVRIESQLYFANARRVMARLRDMVLSADPRPTVVLLDASAMTDTDVTAAEAFEQLHDDLAAAGIDLWVANLHKRARELAARRVRWAGAQDRLFPTLDAAVEGSRSRS
jgi:SulP family sulfate permease